MKSSNLILAGLFALSLMIMGMAGLPFVIFKAADPSPHLVVGLRLTFVGIFALAVGLFTGFKDPLKSELCRTDVKDWAVFVVIAVFGVNCALTYALFLLDNRLAMAVMLLAIGIVFVWHYPRNAAAWMAATLAIIGTALLAAHELKNIEIDGEFMTGVVFAAIGGLAQGLLFFRKPLMPKNINPGIALGSAFLLGGLSMITVSAILSPNEQPLLEMPIFVGAMFISALMTVFGWLILGYAADRMTGAQKTGAAAMEPVGAAVKEYVTDRHAGTNEVIAVLVLAASAAMAVLLNKDPK